MYLSENRTLRLLTLCGLYVAQGIPWGFVTVTFAAWLAEPQNGLTVKQIGPILAVASLPWSFKFLWGPLLDRFTIPSLGRRRPWIILSQGMAIIVLGSMLFFDNLPGMVWTDVPDTGSWFRPLYAVVPGPLAAMILLANLFVSMQDVAVDALAVDLLEEKERGVANGLMYSCSYLGTAIGGFGLGQIVAAYGIRAGIVGQAVLLLLIMMLPVLMRERRSIQSADDPSQSGDLLRNDGVAESERHSERMVVEPVFANLWKAFRLRSAAIGVVVALSVRIGIGVLTAVFVDYLLKDGGWTLAEYTSVTGGYAVMLGLTGSVAGGFAADRFGPKQMIIGMSLLLGVLWMTFGFVPAALGSRWLVTGLLLTQELVLAVLSVSLFSLFMSISWPGVAATQFTTYMALMNLSTTIGSYAAGQVDVVNGIHRILILAGLLQTAVIIPVLFIDPTETRRILGTASPISPDS
ncbi:MAG: MFS transporter [Planctomycetaceae bacterium]